MAMAKLPPFPDIRLHVVGDTTEGSRCDEGFVRVRRRRLELAFPDGSKSSPFAYDEAWRKSLDAVAVCAYFLSEAGEPHVYLRSAVRPPALLRPREIWPLPEKPSLGHLWEIPAGLVEEDERSEAGLRLCASRELGEELGFSVDPGAIEPLGAAMFPTPGLIGERVFFFKTEVDPKTQKEPSEDGSALERFAQIAHLPLRDAMAMVRAGELEDMKTELGLRRLADRLLP